MKRLVCSAAVMLAVALLPAHAQVANISDEGDYLAGADMRSSSQTPNRPVIGLRRKADFVAVQVAFSSDSRDAQVRKTEIHAMLLAAIERAGGAGLELATGTPRLAPVTKSSFQSLPFQWAGREDTSKADILVKVPLSGSVADADKRIDVFIKALPRNGRGTIEKYASRLLILSNPEHYRGAIVKLVAEDVKRNAEMFGPDYRGSIDGIDRSVLWAAVSDTDVFLYLPYTYRIIAK